MSVVVDKDHHVVLTFVVLSPEPLPGEDPLAYVECLVDHCVEHLNRDTIRGGIIDALAAMGRRVEP